MLIFFWLSSGAAAVTAASIGHPFSGIRPLSPATLKAMARRSAARAHDRRIRTDDAEAMLILLGD